MSENITILEGGKAENFGQIARLRTDDGNGGHDLWVPAKDVETGQITIKKNGLYYTNSYTPTSAEKKDKDSHHYDIYGWEQITVSVSKKVKGKNSSGNPAVVDVDDDGNLIETELPVRIEIITPPTKLEYITAEPIDISGIVVKAYLEDGTEWGEVPFNELSWEPIAAQAPSDIYTKGGIRCVKLSCSAFSNTRYFRDSDGNGYYYYPNHLWMGKYSSSSPDYDAYTFWGRITAGDMYITRYNDPNYGMMVFGVCLDDTTTRGVASSYDDVAHDGFGSNPSARANGVFGNSGSSMSGHADYEWIPESTENPAYKSFVGAVPEGDETVTISWSNDDIDPPLTDTYEISVTDPPVPPVG